MTELSAATATAAAHLPTAQATASATSPTEHRLSVLISGSGTNLQAIINACPAHSTSSIPTPPSTAPQPSLPSCRIVRVLSNRLKAKGLDRAKKVGIPSTYHNILKFTEEYAQKHKGDTNRDPADKSSYDEAAIKKDARIAYDVRLAELVLADRPELVVLAGFMHVVSPPFLERLADAGVKIINLHPALPGQYPGATALESAHADWQAGRIAATGLMIHHVIEAVDEGDAILTRRYVFEKGVDDDLDTFKNSFHRLEWAAIVQGTRLALGMQEQIGVAAADVEV